MSNLVQTWSVVAAIAALVGCAPQSRPGANAAASQPPAPAASTTSAATAKSSTQPSSQMVMTSGGAYCLILTPAAKDFPANRMFTMNVQILGGADRQPVKDDVQLAVDAAMPAHRHGMITVPKVSRNPDGTFIVRGMMLHMSGDWEVHLDVTRGGVTERAQMAVTLE